MLGKKKAHAFWFSRKWLSKSYDHDMIWNVGCYKLKWLLYVEEGCIYAAQHKPNQRDSLRPQLTRGSLFTLDSIPYIIILLHIFFSLEFQQGIIWRDSFYYILKKQHVKSINTNHQIVAMKCIMLYLIYNSKYLGYTSSSLSIFILWISSFFFSWTSSF